MHTAAARLISDRVYPSGGCPKPLPRPWVTGAATREALQGLREEDMDSFAGDLKKGRWLPFVRQWDNTPTHFPGTQPLRSVPFSTSGKFHTVLVHNTSALHRTHHPGPEIVLTLIALKTFRTASSLISISSSLAEQKNVNFH